LTGVYYDRACRIGYAYAPRQHLAVGDAIGYGTHEIRAANAYRRMGGYEPECLRIALSDLSGNEAHPAFQHRKNNTVLLVFSLFADIAVFAYLKGGIGTHTDQQPWAKTGSATRWRRCAGVCFTCRARWCVMRERGCCKSQQNQFVYSALFVKRASSWRWQIRLEQNVTASNKFNGAHPNGGTALGFSLSNTPAMKGKECFSDAPLIG